MKSFIALFFLLFGFNAFCLDVSGFEKRFELVKKDGKLRLIRDKSITGRFRIAPYLNFIKKSLLQEQKMMLMKGDYENEVSETLGEEFENSNITRDKGLNDQQLIIDSLNELKKLDIEKIFSHPKFNEVMTQFEGRIATALEIIDPRILVNAQNSKFFFRKSLTFKVVTWGLQLAKDRLSEIPILNTASFVLVKVEKLIRERRQFHQNILLHYLENFKATDLGMTHEEANLAFSSVYESRISWFAFWESKNAEENWAKFGVTKFFNGIRFANRRLRSSSEIYRTTRAGRLNYCFQDAETIKNQSGVILNLNDQIDMIRSTPAIAYYRDRPKKIARFRTILQLAELGVSFIPLPNWTKEIAGTYMRSFYEKQRISEGGLYAYFETQNMLEESEVIKAQYMNPFDLLNLY